MQFNRVPFESYLRASNNFDTQNMGRDWPQCPFEFRGCSRSVTFILASLAKMVAPAARSVKTAYTVWEGLLEVCS